MLSDEPEEESGPPANRPLVLLDTNSLFLPFTHGVRLVPEITRWVEGADIRVPRMTLDELRQLEDKGTPNAEAALALAAAFPVWETEGRGDLLLVRAAAEANAVVVTADRELRTRLQEAGLRVLFPRDRDRLDLAEPRPRRATPRKTARRATVKKRARGRPPRVRRRR